MHKGWEKLKDSPKSRPCHTVQFFLQLATQSTLKRCKFVTNVWYVKDIMANCGENMYLPILHLSRVELHCKLQEKLHRVTGPSSLNKVTGRVCQAFIVCYGINSHPTCIVW